MKHHVCAWYVRTLLYVHVCTDIAQYITDGVIEKNSRIRNCRSRNKTSGDAEKEY